MSLSVEELMLVHVAFSAFLGVMLGSLAYGMATATTLVVLADANLIALGVGGIASATAATFMANAAAAQKRPEHANV